MRIGSHALKPVAAATLAALWACSASAFDFTVGDGWKGAWNTTLSISESVRMQGQDNKLYSPADGLVRGRTDGLGGSNTDAGTLNWDRNDAFSQLAKFITDVSVDKNGTGGLVRVKGWYDNALKNGNVAFGNFAQDPKFNAGHPLSDSGLPVLNKFQGIYLLDAYAYTQFNVGERPLQLRLGNQVVNWGESIFIQGINQINPLDFPALRRGAGTEVKEFLLPVPLLYGNLGLPAGASMEAFYQFQWKPATIDGCGSYFEQASTSVSYQPGACNIATTFGPSQPAAVASGIYYVNLLEGKKASNAGQYGIAFRLPVDKIDTEFALYFQNLHSRYPIISASTGTPTPTSPFLFKTGGAADAIAAFWEYPEDIKTFGLTASTNLGGWSTAAELSYAKDVPAQINANDLIAGALQGAGPVGADFRLLAGRVAGTPAAPNGTVFHGYDRFDKTQLQANAVKLFSNVFGAESLAVVGEVGFQWNNVPDYRNGGRRYGRAFTFGNGAGPTFGTTASCLPSNPNPDACKNDGYVTDFAYGFRLKGTLTYNNAFNSGLTFTPSLYYANDTKGVSIDQQFIQGRQALAFGLKVDLNKRYALDVGVTTYADSAKFDPFRDRDFYSIALSATF